MNNLIEILLLVLLSLITIVVLVVSWQVFFFFKELRQTRRQFDEVLAKLSIASQRMIMPIVDFSVAWKFLTHSGRLLKIIDNLLKGSTKSDGRSK